MLFILLYNTYIYIHPNEVEVNLLIYSLQQLHRIPRYSITTNLFAIIIKEIYTINNGHEIY